MNLLKAVDGWKKIGALALIVCVNTVGRSFLTEETISNITQGAMAYIVGQGIADVGKLSV